MQKARGYRVTRLVPAVCAVVAMLGWAVVPARATPVTFTGSSGSLSASAVFANVAGDLQVVLTNTSLADVLIPAEVLTAVFFDVLGHPPLNSSTGSAVLGGSSTVFFDAQGQPAGGIVGGEWGYGSGLVGAPGGATQGLSSSGLGLFGGATFPGADLNLPLALDGLNYGITSGGDNPGTGNAQVTGNVPLIKNTVVFTLSGALGGFDPSALHAVTNVSFQYGTALTEPNVPGSSGGGGILTTPTPEASSLILLGSGLLGLILWGRKTLQARHEAHPQH